MSFHHSQMWWLCGGQGMERCPEQDLFLRKAVCDLGGSFTKLGDFFSCFPKSECSKRRTHKIRET